MARTLGIDLGSHSVKVAIFDGKLGRFELQELRAAPVPQADAAAPPLEQRLEVLGALLAEIGRVDGEQSAVGFPTELASVRVVRLPFADPEKVEKALPVEVENVVPFDLEDMVLTHRIDEVVGGKTSVVVALSEQGPVRDLLSGLAAHKVDPRFLAVDGDLLGAFGRAGGVAVVDLGHTRTLVSLVRKGKVIATRALSGGGHALTMALGEARGIAYAEAEERKHRTRLLLPAQMSGGVLPVEDDWETEDERTQPAVHISDGAILARAALPLVTELRSTLLAFEDSAGVEIDEVVLVGGTSALAGLRDWLSALLGVPVRTPPVGDSDPESNSGRFALAHALGEKASDSKASLLDLRRGEFVYKGDIALIGLIVRVGVMALAATFLMGLLLFGYKTWSFNRQMEQLDADIAAAVLATFPDAEASRLKDPSMAKAIMQEKTTATATRVANLGTILSDEPPATTMLTDLTEAVPPPDQARIAVTELTLSETSITMKAETDGFESATRIESSLQRSERFKSAQKGDEKKSKDGVRFTITIPLGVESDAASEG
jgi:type IV pilus assembly protein PilM